MTLLRAIVAALVVFTAAASSKTIERDVALMPADHQKTVTRLATRYLTRSHYRRTQLDNELSSQILDQYLTSLDPNRSFFIASDIAAFDAYKYQLDDALQKEDLGPAFAIFNIYRHRVGERVEYARKLLDEEFAFDIDESYRIDRSDDPWPENESALNELWRKRVKNDVLRLRLTDKDPEEARTTLLKRYNELGKRVAELDSEDVFQLFLNAFAGSIEPHTSYLAPRTSENFQISMRLSLEGIGAVLQRQNEYTTIDRIVEGGPAGLSGLVKEGDRIVAVAEGTDDDPVDVIGWRLDDVVELIRGPKGSTVRLYILPAETALGGPVETVSLVRDRVKLEEQAAKSSLLDVELDGEKKLIGVIDLPTFYLDFGARARREPDYRSSTRDVRRLIEEFKEQGVDGVIMDLRNNGGGSLLEATELTGLFIDKGPVVQVRNASDRIDVEVDDNPGVDWAGPLTVLVNRHSASASEIFAAAIQDYGRGLIVGEPTFGKGTVQNLVDLDRYAGGRDNEQARYGQLKLTIAQFFRVNGGSTQHRGVIPDVRFPTLIDGEEYGESAFDNALPWSSEKAARYSIYGDFSRLVPTLEQRSTKRLESNQEFAYLMEDIEAFREARNTKEVSLLETQRRQEMDEAEARRLARRTERAERNGIDLDDVEVSVPQVQGQDPDLAVIELDGDDDDAEIEDVLLQETAYILADLITYGAKVRRTASTNK